MSVLFRSVDFFTFSALFDEYTFTLPAKSHGRGFDFLTKTFVDLSVSDSGAALNRLKSSAIGAMGFRTLWRECELSTPFQIHALFLTISQTLLDRLTSGILHQAFSDYYATCSTTTVQRFLMDLGCSRDQMGQIIVGVWGPYHTLTFTADISQVSEADQLGLFRGFCSVMADAGVDLTYFMMPHTTHEDQQLMLRIQGRLDRAEFGWIGDDVTD